MYGQKNCQKDLNKISVTCQWLYQGKLLQLAKEKMRLPSGKYTVRETIHHPGSCAIIPILPRKKVILIRQLRPSVRQFLWEIPAGTLEKGESPRTCAKRELGEEIGYQARRLKKLTTFYTAPGFCTEKMHLFVAKDLIRTSQKLEEDESIQARSFSLRAIQQMIRRGVIRDAKTIVGVGFLSNSL